MENLEKIRGNAWIAFLLERGGFKSLAELHEGLAVVETSQLWGMYHRGVAHPQESTVKLIDRAIPGSASLWFNGPDGLPLWAVLDDNLSVCMQVVDGVLVDFPQPQEWMLLARKPFSRMDLADKTKALFEVVLPERVIWQPKDAPFPHPLLPMPQKNNLDGWLSLSQLFETEQNIFAHRYLNDYLKSKEKSIIKAFVFGMVSKMTGKKVFADDEIEHNLSNPTYVLSMIALLQLCFSSDDERLLKAPEYIKNGIKQSVLDCFGQDVMEFVINI